MSELTVPKETKVTPPQIRNLKELATALGFRLDEESSTGRLRVYTKPFKVGGGEGLQMLSFDAVYKPLGEEKPYQHERIGFSVRLGNSPAWKKELIAQDMREILGGLEIKKDKKGAFEKSSLKKSGYQKLYGFLSSELEEGGRLHEASERFINEMVEEHAEGIRFIENKLVPQVQERFPGFPSMVNKYEEDKEIYFFGDAERGETVPVIRFFIRPYQIGPSTHLTVLIESGRSKIINGQVDEDYFHSYGKPYTVALPEEMRDINQPRASWTFDELGESLDQLEKHLEGKQSK